jgi:hypothetical protein
MRKLFVLGAALAIAITATSIAIAAGQDGGAPESSFTIPWDPKNQPTCPATNGQTFGWKFDLEDGADANFGPVHLKVVNGTLYWTLIDPAYDTAYIGIKGGPSEVKFYKFDFEAATAWDDGGTLTAPINPKTNRPYGVSHVYICLDPKGFGDN